jgi:protein SCO1/2
MRSLAVAALLLAAVSLHAGTTSVALHVPDVTLRDQDGKQVRVAELVRDRVVVMNFVFTSCTTVCSPMGANFGALQGHVDPDVRLVSVSIDPGMDTPARLKRWSAQFHAGTSWTLLTGEPAEVTALLKALGVYSANRFSHAPILLVGDGTGRWVRANGLIAPAEVVKMIRGIREDASR